MRVGESNGGRRGDQETWGTIYDRGRSGELRQVSAPWCLRVQVIRDCLFAQHPMVLHARLPCKWSCKIEGHVSVCEHCVCLFWISSEMQINEILYFCGRRGVWLCSNHGCTMVWNSRTTPSQPNRGKSQGMSVPPHTKNTNTVVFFVQGKIRNFPGTLCQEERGQSERKEHRRRNI